MHAVKVTGWILVALPIVAFVYAYIVYPAILRLLPQQPDLARQTTGELPTVSIVVPAYNEEGQIRQTIEALINQEYPADRRQILILSDSSTDRTDDIVREYAGQGVELLRLETRG